MDTLSSQPNNLPEENMPKKKVWILAFIFSFLALLVDGADLALLAYSLTSLKQEFSLSSIQAGALGSWTLAGMAIGGAYNIGRLGAVLAPVTIGYFAQGGSIGTGLLIMSVAYFVCGLIPAIFIKNRLFDPQKAD